MATSQSSTAITTQGKEEPASAQTAEGSSSLPRSAARVDDAAASEGDDNPTHSVTPNGRAIASADHSVSAEPGQVPSTQPAHSSPNGTSQAAPQNVSLTSPPSGKEKADDSEGQKETDKDKASFDTTLTGTHTNPRTQSSPRKQTKTVSEGAHTASTSGEEKPSRPKSLKKKAKVKASLFSRLFHVFVPCIGPSNRAHVIEPQAPKPKSSAPPVPVPAAPVALKEKQPSKEAEELPPKPEPESPAPPAAVEEQPSKTEETSVVPSPLQPIEIPSQPSDSEVVVPPTPTRSLLPREETEGVTSGAVQPPGSTGEEGLHEHHEHHHTHTQDSENESDGSTSFTDDDDLDDGTPMDEIEDEEERLIMSGGAGIPIGPDGMPRPLLPPLSPKHAGRKCLVLDLDETLVHSSFKSIQQADYVVPVEIEYHWHNVYVIKRPGVDSFLKKMGEIYEVVVFTASLSKYADPVLDKLDVNRVVSHRLFRESCYNHRGNYVKDLSQLGRPISDTIIIDNSPASYIFHPNNAVPVSSWFTDPHDQELSDLCPFLTDLATVDDIRGVLDGGL